METVINKKQAIDFLNQNDVYENHYMSEDDDGDIYWDDDEAIKFMEEEWLDKDLIPFALTMLQDWLENDKEDRDSWESEFESLTGYKSAAEFYWV